MKMLWFHLMPYTELPDDFKEKHPSVWVDIHSSLFDPKRAHHMYNDFLDELEYAAECGFDAICCNEHHSNGYGLMPSPNLIATALARRTTDTAICVMGNSLALYNPPTRVAEEFAMIDCISGGRLIAGFPVGTPMDTTFAYGQNPSMLRERYLEAHDLVMRAWQEKDTFAFNGRFNQQRYVNIWPRPIQQPHPPVWIPGGGSVETWRWCAEMDYVYCYLSYYGYKAGQATMQGFWDEMDRLGKDRNPYRAGFLQFVGVAESRSEAMERYAEAAEYFYGRCLHVDPRFASPPGYNTEATMRAGLESQVKRAADEAARAQAESAQPGHNKPKDQLAGVTTGTTAGTRFNMVARNMEEIVDRGYVVVGSPKDVAEQLEYVAKTLNVGHFMLLLQYGNMSKELTKYNTKLFAEQVMPKLKPLFSEWEDKWWPKPMDKSARAALPAFRPAAAE
jgi:alkanesulfonate monooxygenase SsuD/methylene tetrahydromethanopterin reductase-like flavin-dependent oxidoreductase (luciferase family)